MQYIKIRVLVLVCIIIVIMWYFYKMLYRENIYQTMPTGKFMNLKSSLAFWT